MSKIYLFKTVIFLFLTGCCSLPMQGEARSKQSYEEAIHKYERILIDLINQERVKNGLAPLAHWDVLSHYARGHSQDMAAGKVPVGHKRFDRRAKSIKKHAQYRTLGENVAYCLGMNDPLDVFVRGWMESPGHRKNILGDFEETGIGIAIDKQGGIYATQLFAIRFSNHGVFTKTANQRRRKRLPKQKVYSLNALIGKTAVQGDNG